MATDKVAWSPLGGFTETPGPADDDLARCVHCGLCLNACPTHRATGLETESPRGRIYLMRAVKEGRIDINDAFGTHMDLCLVCRACETACPSGVPFGRLMEATRAELWKKPLESRTRRLARRVGFEILLPHRRLFRLAFRLLQAYQRSGLQTAVRGLGLLRAISPALADREKLSPPLDHRFYDVDSMMPARVPGRPRVGFVAGCVMSTAFGDVQRSSVRVLEAFGCQVVTPPGQGCCGALNVHAGERKHARRMARALIESMLAADVDAVIINSAGCGSAMKEYHELFEDEPQYLSRVRAFEAKVMDFSEYLVTLPAFHEGRVRMSAPDATRLVYQDACHLRHAQRVISQPRALLERVDGVQLVELSLPDQCCGSAGTYNLEHPALSNQILDAKVADIRQAEAEVLVSGNPGCILQIRKGLTEVGLTMRVEHIATFLDRAITDAAARA